MWMCHCITAELARTRNIEFISAFCSYRVFISSVGGKIISDPAKKLVVQT